MQKHTPVGGANLATAGEVGGATDDVIPSLASQQPTQEDIPLDPDDIAMEEELFMASTACHSRSSAMATGEAAVTSGDLADSITGPVPDTNQALHAIQSTGPNSRPVSAYGGSSETPCQEEMASEHFSQPPTAKLHPKGLRTCPVVATRSGQTQPNLDVDAMGMHPVPGDVTPSTVPPSATADRLPQESPRGGASGGVSCEPPDAEDEFDSQFMEELMGEFTSPDDFYEQLDDCSHEEIEPDPGDPDWCLDEGSLAFTHMHTHTHTHIHAHTHTHTYIYIVVYPCFHFGS